MHGYICAITQRAFFHIAWRTIHWLSSTEKRSCFLLNSRLTGPLPMNQIRIRTLQVLVSGSIHPAKVDVHTTLQRHNPYAGGGGGTEEVTGSSSLSCNPSSSSLANITRIGLCGRANPFSSASLRTLPARSRCRACRASMQSRIR